jgi:hypothetical protein
LLILHQANWVVLSIWLPLSPSFFHHHYQQQQHIKRASNSVRVHSFFFCPLSNEFILHAYIYSHRKGKKKKKCWTVYVYMCSLAVSHPSFSHTEIFFLWVLYCSTKHHRRSCVWYGFIHIREWEKDEIDSWSKDETTRVMVITVCSACTYELALNCVSRIDKREKCYGNNRVRDMIDEQLPETDKVC